MLHIIQFVKQYRGSLLCSAGAVYSVLTYDWRGPYQMALYDFTVDLWTLILCLLVVAFVVEARLK